VVNLGPDRLYRYFIGHGYNPVFPAKTAGAYTLSPATAHGFAAITADSGNHHRRSLQFEFYRGRFAGVQPEPVGVAIAVAQPKPVGLTVAVTFTPTERLF